MNDYRSILLIIILPLALLIQNLYSQISITFWNKKRIFIMICVTVSFSFSIIGIIYKVFPVYVYFEILAITLGSLLILKFISRDDAKLSIKEFASIELIPIIPKIVLGLFICVLPLTNIYTNYIIKSFNNNYKILSIFFYEAYGITLIFFNRLVFCSIYNIFYKDKGGF